MTVRFPSVAFALTFVSTLACSKGRKPCPSDNGPNWTVLSAGQAARIAGGARLPDIPSWTPSPSDIARMENALDGLLRAECLRLSRGNRVVRLDSYLRQYAGKFRDGRRVILINAFSKWDFEHGYVCDWRKEAVQIADGGQGYFRAAYDVESRRFGYFHFNGPLRGEPPPADRWAEILRDHSPSEPNE